MDQRTIIQQQALKLNQQQLCITAFSTIIAKYQVGIEHLIKKHQETGDVDAADLKALVQDPREVVDSLIRAEIALSQLRNLVARQQTQIEHQEALIKSLKNQ